MAMPLLGTGGSAVLPAADTTIFDASVNGGPVDGYYLKASAAVKVRVHGMHLDQTDVGGTDGRAPLAADEGRLFVNDHGPIDKVTCEPDSGTCTLTGYVQKK